MCPCTQVIKLLHNAFEAAGLSLYLRPYGCLPTGYECGIIEVVPSTKSRAALGELSDRGLHDIFTAEFGAPGSPAFEKARENFIVSEAAYAVASYLLQVRSCFGIADRSSTKSLFRGMVLCKVSAAAAPSELLEKSITSAVFC